MYKKDFEDRSVKNKERLLQKLGKITKIEPEIIEEDKPKKVKKTKPVVHLPNDESMFNPYPDEMVDLMENPDYL